MGGPRTKALHLPRCKHCRHRKALREHRGLCDHCYQTPDIRTLYPPCAGKNSGGLGLGATPRILPKPCRWPPGHIKRQAAYRGRLRRGQLLHHPHDSFFDAEGLHWWDGERWRLDPKAGVTAAIVGDEVRLVLVGNSTLEMAAA